MSSIVDTLASIVRKNFKNSLLRCRRWVSPITWPVAMFSAANRVVVPWRSYSWVRRAGMPGTSAALRSSALELMGSGIGSIPFEGLLRFIRDVLTCAATGGLLVTSTPIPLIDVTQAWGLGRSDSRIVFTV